MNSSNGSWASEIRGKFFFPVFILITMLLVGCSQVHILKPLNGSVFTAGQPIEFEGQITRSTETGGEDRSDRLSWASSIDGHIGDGRTFTTNRLRVGSHGITASWPSHDRSDSISIRVNP